MCTIAIYHLHSGVPKWQSFRLPRFDSRQLWVLAVQVISFGRLPRAAWRLGLKAPCRRPRWHTTGLWQKRWPRPADDEDRVGPFSTTCLIEPLAWQQRDDLGIREHALQGTSGPATCYESYLPGQQGAAGGFSGQHDEGQLGGPPVTHASEKMPSLVAMAVATPSTH